MGIWKMEAASAIKSDPKGLAALYTAAMSTKRSLVLLLFVLSSGLFGQDFRATVLGSVTDPTGAVVPNATVKAVNTATNETKQVQTDAQGAYTIPYLDPGNYTFEFSAAGFQVLKREQITLSVAQKLNLNATLTIGQVHHRSHRSRAGGVDRHGGCKPRRDLRPPENPGISLERAAELHADDADSRRAVHDLHVRSERQLRHPRLGCDQCLQVQRRAQRQREQRVLMNGAVISNEGSTWEFAPSVDSIEEFKVETNAFDAQYGHEAGGVVNTTIKSGTNIWHGDVYDYWRYYAFDANSFNNNVNGTPKGYHNQHQYGGVLGGPIHKSTDFVFFSFEGWQERLPFPTTSTTVPLDVRTGNFSNPAYGMTVYDPLTRHACGAASEPCAQSPYWENPFPNNQIPGNRISPVGTAILNYMPAPNAVGQGQGGISGNYIANPNLGRYWYNQPIVRYDHNFSDKDKFNAMFSEFHGFEYRSSNGFQPPLALGNTDNNRTYTGLNLDETHVITPTMVLDVRANYFRFTQLSPGYTSQAQAITPQIDRHDQYDRGAYGVAGGHPQHRHHRHGNSTRTCSVRAATPGRPTIPGSSLPT